MKRVLHVHGIQARRGGRASVSRMKVDEWQAEVNRMCLAAFCLESMYRAVDEAGDPLFPDCIMQKLSVSIIEGEHLEELQQIVSIMDPHFQVEQISFWQENLPQTSASKEALEQADRQLAALSDDARAKAWQHDKLMLARDVATISKVYDAVEKSARSKRVQRVCHMRNENAIGASVISGYLEKNGLHRSGSEEQCLAYLEQEGLNGKDLNHCLDLVTALLTKQPLRSLSEAQEAAQILSGPDVPRALLEALLAKVSVSNLAVVNATPYDGWLERTCLKWHLDHEAFKVVHLSLTKQPVLTDYVQKVLALELMQAISCETVAAHFDPAQFV
ncbi:unnamed protein product [Durusdinium trenchii]|uniref:Uncharacterized protein n=1 Tax=Durusdinium trenchii TaxID=1381693 RepID=A0ABP0KRW4_9DINO